MTQEEKKEILNNFRKYLNTHKGVKERIRFFDVYADLPDSVVEKMKEVLADKIFPSDKEYDNER